VIATLAALAFSAAPAPSLQGQWQISHGILAPWVEEAQRAQFDANARVGQRAMYRPDRVDAPGVLACGGARFQTVSAPFEGLFQGNLKSPEQDAANLGLTQAPVPTVSVTCDSGLFDLHFANDDAALLALDNVIWVLDRSPGALAADGTPEQAVQALLQDHYAHGLAFSPERLAAQRTRLSATLAQRADAYFAQDLPEDEAPPIDGDPYTDSQDYPPLFSVRAAEVDGDTARVPVRFDFGSEARTLEYRLRREDAAWKLDDIGYSHGSFRELLALQP